MKYKAKSCFEMKDVAGDVVVIPRGESSLEFNGVLVLNDSCVVLWKKLEKFSTAEELANALVEQFGIDFETALKDTEICIKKMLDTELLDTEE